MSQPPDIATQINSTLQGGDIVFIVPPFGSVHDPALGPQILQRLAQEQGYTAEVLYLNMLLAATIGLDEYEAVCAAPEYWMLGERMFARSAHDLPPLGRHAERTADEAFAVSGGEAHCTMFYDPAPPFDLVAALAVEGRCHAFLQEAIAAIAALNYRIVGCTAQEGQSNGSIALLAGLKNASPATLTILGGANCEGRLAQGMASLCPSIDYLFSGESENSFSDFLSALAAGNPPQERIIQPGPPIDLDTLPLPDYEIFSRQHERFLGETAAPKMRIGYESSRGCWWGAQQKCRFCGVLKLDYRHKSPQKAAADMTRIKACYPERLLVMADNIMPRNFPEQLRRHASREELPSTAYQVKSNLGLPELLRLKEANIQAILPGIESFSSHMLALMHKGASAWQQILLLRNARSLGIYVDWFLLWGLPGDALQDYEELLALLPSLRHLQAPRRFAPMLLMPFSAYLSDPQAYGIERARPWSVYDSIYPESAECAAPANYFRAGYPSAGREHPEILRRIAAEIAQWRQSWNKTRLSMLPVAGSYLVFDNRAGGESVKHLIDASRAQAIMRCRPYDDSENLARAVEQRLGLVLDSRYVPLVTAAPDLLRDMVERG